VNVVTAGVVDIRECVNWREQPVTQVARIAPARPVLESGDSHFFLLGGGIAEVRGNAVSRLFPQRGVSPAPES
jgi:hypothetical protein